MPELLRLMRPHQWVKNTFVFIGLLFGHAWQNYGLLSKGLAVFAAFCLTSSAVYIMNDIVDVEQDRQHPKKCRRPLAAGKVSILTAVSLSLLMATIGFGLAYWSSMVVLIILIGYVLMNLAYSFRLKHVVILDVFIIATGFILRILAGTLGLGIPPSQWLLLCGLMVTLFLGFTKRRAESIVLAEDNYVHRKVLEHYSPVLLDMMIGITATGLIMSYGNYTMAPDTIRIHGTDKLIYTVPLVIYGVFRYIYTLHHQNGGGDPSSDLIKDPHLYVVAAAWVGSIILLIR